MTTYVNTSEQQKIVITISSEISKKIDKSVRTQLVEQYRKLFTGFAIVKRAKKYSWGRCWHSALGLTNAMILVSKKIHTPNNPAVKYLESVHGAYKKYWARVIMTHPERDTESDKTNTETQKMHDNGMRMINDATNKIMQIIKMYNEKIQEQIIEQTNHTTQKNKTVSQPQQQPAKTIEAMSMQPQVAQQTQQQPAKAIGAMSMQPQVAQQTQQSQKQNVASKEKPAIMPVATPLTVADKKQMPKAIPVATVAPQTKKLSHAEHMGTTPEKIMQQAQSKPVDTKQQIVPLNTKINQQHFKLFLLKKFNQRCA